MDFEMTEERRLLSETLSRYLAEQYGPEHREAVAYRAPYHDPQKWAELAGLGVLYALADEAHGGFGGSGFDIACVFEPLGRALTPEPVLPALIAARLLSVAGADLSPLLSGKTHYAIAAGEIDAPYAPEDILTTATQRAGKWALSGRKSVVYGGGIAQRFLVLARMGVRLGLFEVARSDADVTPSGMIDGGGAAELFLDDTPALLLLKDAEAAIQDALDAGALALSAEAVGIMDACQDMTLEYLKTREQFGVPIGSFQALQHRMVDMLSEIEQARSITILAASRMGTSEQSRTVSMCKNLIGRSAKLVAEETIQLHGGIAMTWEYPASHYAKRLVMIDHQMGDTDFHLERVMAAHQET